VLATPGFVATLDGANYPVIDASKVVIAHDATHDADLMVARIQPYPKQLPLLPLRSSTPSLGKPVVMIGKGFDRGTASSWGAGGWNWLAPGYKRWGTNAVGGDLPGAPPTQVNVVDVDGTYGASSRTRSLVIEFNPGSHDAMATLGDSGGPLFIKNVNTWEVAGIAIAVTVESGQPASTSIYGNDSLYADLAYYRSQILDVTRPCDDGVDNDGDGRVDLADSGCTWAGDMSEQPDCSDGLDNDFDGQIDLADSNCASASGALEEPDQDGDLVPDPEDNCLTKPNPTQVDTDLDGYGNACDADYDDNGVVGIVDFLALSVAYGASEGQPNYDPAIDSNSDGTIGVPEFNLLSVTLGGSPGPSGLACAGTIPCQ
jgi:hypothetical protein